MKATLFVLLCVSSTWMRSTVVIAQSPSDTVRAEARERFARGLHMFDNGDGGGALAEFKRAYELIPNRLVLYNIGLVYAAIQKPVEAVDTLRTVLEDTGPLKPEQLARAQEVRTAQERLIGAIEVKTNVPGEVEVDGIHVAHTPLPAPLRVASGAHVVGIVAPGYLPLRREIAVAGGVQASLSFDLQPTELRLAHIDVRCAVPGADVLVDGVLVGKTPLATTVPTAPGTRAIEVRRAGYLVQRREVTLADGARGETSFDLEEDPTTRSDQRGRLTLVLPDDGLVQVTIDDRKRGLYREALVLPLGPHRLRLERAGFEPLDRTIQVPGGGEAPVSVNLRPTLETRQAYQSHVRTYRVWAFSTLIGGLVFAGAGGTLALWSNSRFASANTALATVQSDWTRYAGGPCDHSLALTDGEIAKCDVRLADAQNDVSKYRNLRTAGIAAASVGGALVGTGILLLVLGPDPARYDEKTPARSASAPRWLPAFSIGPKGSAIGLSGRF
jgi:hypothetical protein